MPAIDKLDTTSSAENCQYADGPHSRTRWQTPEILSYYRRRTEANRRFQRWLEWDPVNLSFWNEGGYWKCGNRNFLRGCAFYGLAVGIMWPGSISISSQKCPRGGTAMFAFLALAGDLGATVSPTMVGSISELAGGNLKTGLLVATVFPVLLVVGLLILKSSERKAASKKCSFWDEAVVRSCKPAPYLIWKRKEKHIRRWTAPPFVRQVWYTCTNKWEAFIMPKGIPNERYTYKFKQIVLKTRIRFDIERK